MKRPTRNHVFIAALTAVTIPVAFAAPLGIAMAAEKPEKQLIEGKIDWVYDYQQGQQASRESGKPMFVVFRCER